MLDRDCSSCDYVLAFTQHLVLNNNICFKLCSIVTLHEFPVFNALNQNIHRLTAVIYLCTSFARICNPEQWYVSREAAQEAWGGGGHYYQW